MSQGNLINGTLLNGDIFVAGFATASITPTGEVSAIGDMDLAVLTTLRGDQGPKSENAARFIVQIGLSAAQTAAVSYAGSLDPAGKVALYAGQSARAVNAAISTTRNGLSISQSCRASSIAITRNVKTLYAAQVVSVEYSGNVVPVVSLTATQPSTALSDAYARMKLGFASTQRCVADCTLDEGYLDTLPAPEERGMIVPYEDRRMVVI